MRSNDLDFARANAEDRIRGSLSAVLRRVARCEFSWVSIVQGYRILAICALLRDGDRDAFAAFLSRSARARLGFLEAVAAGWNADPKTLLVSSDVGFSAALAAGEVDVARRIASLSSRAVNRDFEYEDDYLFFRAMHISLLDPGDLSALDIVLSRWETVLEGQQSGYLAACRGLCDGTESSFSTGMQRLIAYRKAQLKKHRESGPVDGEILATEGEIFVEGYALLRLAELRGIPTLREYELLPRTGRVPLNSPLPPAEAWMQF